MEEDELTVVDKIVVKEVVLDVVDERMLEGLILLIVEELVK